MATSWKRVALKLRYVLHVAVCNDCTRFNRCKRRQELRDRILDQATIYDNKPNARGQLRIASARILVVPMSAYIAAEGSYLPDVVSASIRRGPYCYPQIEIDLASSKGLEIDSESLEIWLVDSYAPLVLKDSTAVFSMDEATLIIRPRNEAMTRLQHFGEALLTGFTRDLRVYVGGMPVYGSDAPISLRYLDVAALTEEAEGEPDVERERIVKAFGEEGLGVGWPLLPTATTKAAKRSRRRKP